MTGMASERPRVLVTGASGYLGRAAAAALGREGVRVARGARTAPPGDGREWVCYGDLGADRDLSQAVAGFDAIVHFAGLAHVPPGSEAAARARAVNVEGTLRLARAAARAGAARFLYVSSAQVHGSRSPGRPIREDDPPRPADIYATSKLEAERLLRETCAASGMAFVILRPPMVYGPGSPGNFHRLAQLAASGWPLPFGRATAPKSFIGVDNLSSAVVRATLDPRAANGTFLVSDAGTISTAELVSRIAAMLGRPSRGIPVPESLMRFAGRMTGRSRDIARLFDPFEIDASRIRETLGWSPPVSTNEGVARALGVARAEGARDRA